MIWSTIKNAHNWLSGESKTRSLPERIQKLIEEQQYQSELLIGWIQLGVLASFGALYALSQSTPMPNTSFQPVPWVLSLYCVFTILRLTLGYKRRIPYWFLVVSVIVDMALLLGLIWTFHLQYQQPASFYLKAPTLLYVFIFIALRALRFEPGFVVLSGLVAAFGWLLLAAYAVWDAGSSQAITHSFIEYMTSNMILLGAEYDKVLSILAVTLILTITIARARKRLIEAVSIQETARGLSRFVPEDVVDQISSSETPVHVGQSETREATVLFVDIEAFTTIGESLTPQQLVDTLNEYFAVVAEPIREHYGEICQFQGDAILASFNLPKAHEKHARNAVLAGLGIFRRLSEHRFNNGLKLNARIGVNSGTVVGGLVGTPDRLGYTIHGDAVNLASRLEQLNKQYNTRLLVAERTCELVGYNEFQFDLVGEQSGRGRQAQIKIFTVREQPSD